MSKKIWISFIAVYIFIELADFLIHGVLLSSTYQSLMTLAPGLYRPEGEQKLWILFVIALFFAFFFVFIFSKGYQGKGIAEGLRYGLYIAMLTSLPAAYAEYAMHPLPYSMALTWFCTDTIKLLVAGIIVAMIFGGKQKEGTPA
jgi:hypothetical protein